MCPNKAKDHTVAQSSVAIGDSFVSLDVFVELGFASGRQHVTVVLAAILDT